jgi:hypothetical protein
MKIIPRQFGPALAGAMLLAAAFVFQASGVAADEYTRRATAATRVSVSDLAAGRRDRLEFDSGEFKGWLDRKGEWYVEGDVSHVGLLCGVYETGLRFGKGDPGCTNVDWLSEVHYGSRRTQCNGATVKHAAWHNEPALEAQFEKITCAERVIRCTGNCK